MDKKRKDLYNHRVSISGLNLLARSPRAYKQYIENPRDEESEALRKGSALDCMLTEPDKFDERFAVADITPPGGMMGEFVRVFLSSSTNAINEQDQEAFEEALKTAYNASGFKTKYETVIKKFEAPEVQDYILFVLGSKDKTILSPNEWASALGMKEMLLNNEFTKKYLVDLPALPTIEVHDQLKIEWKHGEFECISILDKVIVDHAKKEIIPIDIKTTSKGVGNFVQSYLRFGYFRQCSFYISAIKYWLHNISEIKNPDEWSIAKFHFIVVDSNLNDFPLIYTVSDQDIEVGRNGGALPNSSMIVTGWANLLDSLTFHQKERDWRYTQEQFEKHGKLELNIFM